MPSIAGATRLRPRFRAGPGAPASPDSSAQEVFVVLWWIGNIVLIAVVAPVCLLFLNRVLRPAKVLS